MDITIQPASLADAESILALQKLAYQSELELYGDASIPPLLQTVEEIRKEFESRIFLKAVLEQELAGSVRAYEWEGTVYVGRLIVHPIRQNQGIGTKLLYAIEDCFPKADRFELFTGHRSLRNIHLYEKLGYVIFRTVPVHERLSLVYMEKANRLEKEPLQK